MLKEFSRALKAERESIISFSLEGIIRENNKKEEILKRLEYVEAEKEKLFSSVSERAALTETEAWSSVAEQIKESVREVRTALEKNMKLLSFSMDHVKTSLEKIMSFINRTSYREGKKRFDHGVEEGLMSIGTILNIAQSGLDASQVAIQTTSHNIANVDTPGYTEQQAVLEEAQPTPTSVGLMGDGVTVAQIKSYVDQSLQNAITSKNSDVQEQQTYETNLTQIQSIFNEDNSQLSTNMSTFFNDWSTLSTDPTSTADKETVAADGKDPVHDLQYHVQ